MSVISNRFNVEDVNGLVDQLRQFGIFLRTSGSGSYYRIEFDWENTRLYNDKDEELSFEQHVMPYIEEGQVLIVYDGWQADAYIREGSEVKRTNVFLGSEIRSKAAQEFGVPIDNID